MPSHHPNQHALQKPKLILGCWRANQLDHQALCAWLGTAFDNGLNFFDHADIYGQGQSESKFGAAIASMTLQRDELIIQSKCGIRPGYYDSSKQHILDAANGSLQRLNTDYLDVLLLHRPDALMEPDQVAEAFIELFESGKVRHFGVSNFKPMQIELLRKALPMPLLFNQLQFGLAHTGMVDSGIYANLRNDSAISRDGDVLDYCRLHDISIQAWSPLQFGFFEGNFIGHPNFPVLNGALSELAQVYDCTPSALAIAWILRHPANMQVLLGTTQASRLLQIQQAQDIQLSHEHWYTLYRAAGHTLP